MQAIIQQNPEIGHALQDPAILRQVGKIIFVHLFLYKYSMYMKM
jgi:hypothetical protein